FYLRIMRKPLEHFYRFSESLYPHELYFLESCQNFQIEDHKRIMAVLLYNLKHRQKPKDFPVDIDKRKYSNLKKWMLEKLEQANVDSQLKHISKLEIKVMLDEVDASTEKEIQNLIRQSNHQHYHFRKIYDLIRHYEDFLLIRLREKADKPVSAYLHKHRAAYQHSRAVHQQMQEATNDIIGQYRHRNQELVRWEKYLKKRVYDDELDGMNRYAAFVRLLFIYLNRGDQKELEALYSFMDEELAQGKFYSRRILSNFYANKVLFLTRFQSLDKAEQYGYLSLQFKNSDYLFYLTNLSAVLLRQGKTEAALQLLRDSFPELRQNPNPHIKLSFIAFYIKCMTDLGRFKDAIEFADNYLKAYDQEILSSRWHLFFVAYFRALMIAEKYSRLLYLSRRYHIESLDLINRHKASYLPTISWYIAISRYVEEGRPTEEVIQKMKEAGSLQELSPQKKKRINDLLKELNPIAPMILHKLKSTLYL
ncbi:MAG: hypothetical protein ACPGVV_10060, partial [Croceimicrobium sp.]